MEANFLLDESISQKKRAKRLKKLYQQRFPDSKQHSIEVRSMFGSRMVYAVPKPRLEPGASKIVNLFRTLMFEMCCAGVSRVLFLEQQDNKNDSDGRVKP